MGLEKKQIVFVNQSSGYLMIDIVEAFEGTFEERILMAGQVIPRNKKPADDVKIERLVQYDRTSAAKRLITWGKAFSKALFLITTKYRKAHLFLVSNPPMAPLIPMFCKNSFDILIYDIYPDALVELSYFKQDSAVVRRWEKWNRKVFSRANNVFTLTDGMKERMTKYVDSEKIKVVPVWTDNDFLKHIAKENNSFLKEQGLLGKFLVMYSGNMGKTHPVGVMVDLAEKLKDNTDIFFLLIGGGDQYKDLEARIAASGLTNIAILPWQPVEMLPYTLSGADLSVVTLGTEAADLSIPSKTYNLMSVGTPVLCVSQPGSALSKLVEKEEIGSAFAHDQHEAIIDFILKSKNDTVFYNDMVGKVLKASQNYTPLNAQKFNTYRNEAV